MRAVQVLGVPAEGVAVPEADAIAVALRSRIIAPADAVTHSVAALRRLRSAGVEQYPNDRRGSPVNMTESRSQVSIGRRLASFRAGVLEVRAAFPPA